MSRTAEQTRHQEFSRYVERRGPALLRTALSLTGNHSDAEDLLQTTLIKMFSRWDRIASPEALDGYVRRAMVNTHISQWRRKRLEVFPTGEPPDLPLPDPTGTTDLADAVNRAVARLPHRQRLTVRLRYFEDRTEAETAALLGVSIGTVKSTAARAVARLRLDTDLTEEAGGAVPAARRKSDGR